MSWLQRARPFLLATCALVCACASDDGHGTDAAASHEAGEPARDGGAPSDGGSDAPADAESAADAGSDPRVELPLLDHKSWRNYDASLDPLKSHQPAVLECNIAGWFIERGQLEVSTADCNYALLEHPSLLDLDADTEVLLELYHFDLNAPEPAEAHVALLFGDELQWETLIPVPLPGNVQQVSFRATRALRVGDAIRFHLHNHGQNSWLLRSVHALLPAP